MKKNMIVGALCIGALLTGCISRNQKPQAKAGADSAAAPLLGGDRDPHGCLGSAGYTWSEVLGDCVRIFEKGIKLTSATDPAATQAAFSLFAADSLRAEVFIPGKALPELLERVPGRNAWGNDLGTWLERTASGWELRQGGQVIYRSE